jgi:predicted house-cleaning noncanonical NTP pyrophosphatase (MazG superfamily)
MKMFTFLQNKLWRDKLPEKMERMGSVIHVKTLDDDAYDHELGRKLVEEAHEVALAATKDELIGELADVFEVIDALCALHGIPRNEILISQEKKREERGGFVQRKFVTVAEHPEGSFGEKYCREQPKKYPEIESEID